MKAIAILRVLSPWDFAEILLVASLLVFFVTGTHA
jgi:hypothetical protein